jgi:hypothetical protein
LLPVWTRARNIIPDQALLLTGGAASRCSTFETCTFLIEVAMARHEQGRIVETPTEARQAEPGPSVLILLAVSTGLAVLILGAIWFVFFRT